MRPAPVCHFSPMRIEDFLLTFLFFDVACRPSLSKVCLHVDFHPLSYFSLKGHSLTLSGGEVATFKTWLRCWTSTNRRATLSYSGVQVNPGEPLWCTTIRPVQGHPPPLSSQLPPILPCYPAHIGASSTLCLCICFHFWV